MKFNYKRWLWSIVALMVMTVSACVPVTPNADRGADEDAANAVNADGAEMTLFVGPERISCVGVAPMECLQVWMDPDGEPELFYQGIDGFYYVPGYEYELRVLQTEVENPPADASSLAYTLLEVVSQEPAYQGEVLPLEGTMWQLVAFGVEELVYFSPPALPMDKWRATMAATSIRAAIPQRMVN